MKDNCDRCGKDLPPGAKGVERFRLSRLFGAAETLCFNCWATALQQRAQWQQRWLLGLLLVDVVSGTVCFGLRQTSLGFVFYALAGGLFVAWIANRITTRLILRGIDQVRRRRDEH